MLKQLRKKIVQAKLIKRQNITTIHHQLFINIFERGLNNVDYCKDHMCPDSSDEW